MSTSAVRAEPVSRWRAASSPGGLIGILLVILAMLLAGGSLLVIGGGATLPVHPSLVWASLILSLALAAAVVYLVYGYLSITYELTERALIIRWAHRRHVIPLDQIQHIGPASDHLVTRPNRWQRLWPGYYVDRVPSSLGSIQVVATLPIRRQLLVVAGDQRFAISPERPVLFVEEYGRLRRALDAQRAEGFPSVQPGEAAERLARAGWTMQYPTIPPRIPGRPVATSERPAAQSPSRPAGAERERGVSPLLRPVLLGDPLSVGLLAAAVLLNLVMVIYILIQYDTLPPSIVLHWNVSGDPGRVGSPREIWTIPIITGLVTVANFGLAWSIAMFDRFAARFLLGAACIVHLVAWVALLTLT